MYLPDVLDSAADLIEDHGLTIGELGGPGRGFCAVGALRQVIGANPRAQSVLYYRALDLLIEELGLPYGTAALMGWNDHSSRDEVVAVLRAAARTARANRKVQ